jgi:sarcosine oxidase gamma subunit
VAGATLAHVNAVIQQTSDLPKFRVIVLSSFAQHIAEWLEHATATA